jgi:antitoxin PrlF
MPSYRPWRRSTPSAAFAFLAGLVDDLELTYLLRNAKVMPNCNLHYWIQMVATVTRKGQVTIPKPVRDLLEIKPGSRVDFERAADGRIILVKVGGRQRPSRFARLRGHAGKGLSTAAIMALTRGDS